MNPIRHESLKQPLKVWLEKYKPANHDPTMEKWNDCATYLEKYSETSSSKVLEKRLTDFFLARETGIVAETVKMTTEEFSVASTKRQQTIQGLLDSALAQLEKSFLSSTNLKDQVQLVIGKIRQAKDLNTVLELKEEILDLGQEMIEEMGANQESLSKTMGDYRQTIQSLSDELSEFTDVANKDSSAGVFSKTILEKDLENHVEAAKDRKQTLGLVVLIIKDFFKLKKDFGDEASQKILKDFLEILRTSLRKSDSVYQFLEDEFIVLLPRCSGVSGKHITQRIDRFLGSHSYRFGSQSLKIGTISSFQMLENGETSKEFLTRAILSI